MDSMFIGPRAVSGRLDLGLEDLFKEPEQHLSNYMHTGFRRRLPDTPYPSYLSLLRTVW
jgi:hypothetical protein